MYYAINGIFELIKMTDNRIIAHGVSLDEHIEERNRKLTKPARGWLKLGGRWRMPKQTRRLLRMK